jgi:HAD superfamily hydrolase (TIGR01458 family)
MTAREPNSASAAMTAVAVRHPALPSAIRGLLLDLDGVLCIGSRPIEGAPETIRRLKAAGYPCRFVTNTSTLSRAALHGRLRQGGFDIEPAEIFSAPEAVRRYLKQWGEPRCHLLLAEEVRRDFSDWPQVDIEVADYLVLGDTAEAWTYELLNRLFNRLMQGARLIAVHRNRFWQAETGLRMDIGGLVAALEYCTGGTALTMGKPSPDFFGMALRDMGLEPFQTAMIGDDIEVDIGGGQAAGLTGILVKTGKYREAYAAASPVRPDYVLPTVNELPALLGL